MSNEKSRPGCLPAIIAILGVVFLGSLFSDSEDENSQPTASATTTIAPKITASKKATPKPPLTAGDRACSAMKSADKAVANAATAFYSDSVDQSQIQSLNSSLAAVNNAYKAVDGDLYWYMVGQGNAMDLLASSLSSGDADAAFLAIESYLDNDQYTRFCK